MTKTTINRRSFLQVTALAGGGVLFGLFPKVSAFAQGARGAQAGLLPANFISIASNGMMTSQPWTGGNYPRRKFPVIDPDQIAKPADHRRRSKRNDDPNANSSASGSPAKRPDHKCAISAPPSWASAARPARHSRRAPLANGGRRRGSRL